MELSKNLLEFLVDVEIVSKSDLTSSNNLYKEISFATNEFSKKFYLQYNRRFDESIIFSELQKILLQHDHYYRDEIICGMIVLYALMEKRYRDYQSVLLFFNLIKPIKIKQYIFFAGKPDGNIHGLKFNDFSVGHIDFPKFSNFISNHSGSDYAIRYKNQHQNSIGIEMKFRNIYSLEIYQWLKVLGFKPEKEALTETEDDLVNYYFHHLALASYENFKLEFNKQQQFVTSIFGVTFLLEKLEYLGFNYVNIFYGFSNTDQAGWVLPIQSAVKTIEFPDPRILKQATTFLKKEEKYFLFSDSIFKRQLEIALEFFSNAQRNIQEANFNHAYIDYFVGFDFLLAPDTEKSKKLKQRIALLTHLTINETFDKYLSRLDDLYDLRSEYVHNGKTVDNQSLIEIRNLSRIIIDILIRMHNKTRAIDNKSYENWVKLIDEYVQDLYKGKKLNITALSKIGIDKSVETHFSYDLK